MLSNYGPPFIIISECTVADPTLISNTSKVMWKSNILIVIYTSWIIQIISGSTIGLDDIFQIPATIILVAPHSATVIGNSLNPIIFVISKTQFITKVIRDRLQSPTCIIAKDRLFI